MPLNLPHPAFILAYVQPVSKADPEAWRESENATAPMEQQTVTGVCSPFLDNPVS